MDTTTWVQILDEAICISHSTNMQPTFILPATGRCLVSLRLFTFKLKKENFAFKPIEIRFKKIACVLDLARVKGLINIVLTSFYKITPVRRKTKRPHLIVHVKNELFNISSSLPCRAACTDILDPLSPLLPVVHRLWHVFRATSHILT